VQGADPDIVRSAIETADPLPGTAGFAGRLDDVLVRDVLGRYPLFVESEASADSADWSHDRNDLDEPVSLPAGYRKRGDDAPERLWSLPDPAPYDCERDAVGDLTVAIGEGIATTRPDAGESVAVAFSGGVDSSVVAAGIDAPLYVGGFDGSHDREAARTAAAAMDRELRVVEFTAADVERAVPEVARAIGRPDAMAVQIALPLYLVAEQARADGHEYLAVGQGADELFGGYAKVARAPEDPRVEADTVRGAQREMILTLPDQLERDVLALRAAGVEPVAPLLHDVVVETALKLPAHSLVDDRGERKRAFRRAAREFVPDSIAFREKKAVQYGSLVGRELDRLARQAGFKRRMDDHVTEYVRSQLA